MNDVRPWSAEKLSQLQPATPVAYFPMNGQLSTARIMSVAKDGTSAVITIIGNMTMNGPEVGSHIQVRQEYIHPINQIDALNRIDGEGQVFLRTRAAAYDRILAYFGEKGILEPRFGRESGLQPTDNDVSVGPWDFVIDKPYQVLRVHPNGEVEDRPLGSMSPMTIPEMLRRTLARNGDHL